MAKHHRNSGGRHVQADGRSQRQLKVAESVRRTLADILLRGDVHDPELSRHSITVSEVRASPDLRHMTAFVMPLGGREVEEALAALKRNSGELRHLLAREVRLKYAPELHFVVDESFDRMDETRRLLSEERVRRDVEAGRETDEYGDDFDDDGYDDRDDFDPEDDEPEETAR